MGVYRDRFRHQARPPGLVNCAPEYRRPPTSLAARLLFRYYFDVQIRVNAGSQSLDNCDRTAKVGAQMKSLIVKRPVVLGGHKTSVSVEDAFWNSVKEIAASGKMTVSELLTAIDCGRHHGNLSSAIRLFVLDFYREQLLHRLDIRDERKAIQ
jgi:predicted DNA-binding ribbon-helix-helix protein